MSEARRFRAALVGCGRMGARPSAGLESAFPPGWLPLSHAEAIQSTPGLDLVALCDVDESRARKASEVFRVSGVYSDWKRMIDEAKPEVLAIATRTAGRCDIIHYAAENGVRGIHAEKPLGRSLAEYDRALEAVRAHDVKLSYGTTRRFMDAYRKARELAQSGELGTLQQITIEFGRTWLLWNHPHSVDLMLFLGGCQQVEFVQAAASFPSGALQGDTLDADPVIELGHVHFANGLRGAITVGTGFNTRVAGDRGNAVVAADGTFLEWETNRDQQRAYQTQRSKWTPDPECSGSQRAFRELTDALERGDGLSITLPEIRLAGSILAGLAWSAIHGGRRVKLGEVPAAFTITGRTGEFLA